jgi:hypothetical protein
MTGTVAPGVRNTGLEPGADATIVLSVEPQVLSNGNSNNGGKKGLREAELRAKSQLKPGL